MKRTQLLKDLQDAVNIVKRLENYVRADTDRNGLGQLHRIKVYLQLEHNELRFMDKWVYWESYRKYRK